MWYFLRTDWIPSLPNYEAANEHYEKTKPLRNKPEIRPIGLGADRRRKNFQIHKFACGTIKLTVYGEVVMTFHPDNQIALYTRRLDCLGLAQYFTAVLRKTNVRFRYTYGVVVCSVADASFQHECGGHRVMVGLDYTDYAVRNNFVIQPTSNREFIVRQHEPAYMHRLKRKAMKQVRDKYKGFKAYLLAMISMNPEPQKSNTGIFEGKRKFYTDGRFEELIASTSMDDWYSASLYIIKTTPKTTYTFNDGWIYTPNPIKAVRFLEDRLKKKYFDVLFERVPVDTYKTDHNWLKYGP